MHRLLHGLLYAPRALIDLVVLVPLRIFHCGTTPTCPHLRYSLDQYSRQSPSQDLNQLCTSHRRQRRHQRNKVEKSKVNPRYLSSPVSHDTISLFMQLPSFAPGPRMDFPPIHPPPKCLCGESSKYIKYISYLYLRSSPMAPCLPPLYRRT